MATFICSVSSSWLARSLCTQTKYLGIVMLFERVCMYCRVYKFGKVNCLLETTDGERKRLEISYWFNYIVLLYSSNNQLLVFQCRLFHVSSGWWGQVCHLNQWHSETSELFCSRTESVCFVCVYCSLWCV